MQYDGYVDEIWQKNKDGEDVILFSSLSLVKYCSMEKLISFNIENDPFSHLHSFSF